MDAESTDPGLGPPSADAERAPAFGRFSVIERAGAGAIGVVYAAYDPALDRRVALKVLRRRANAEHMRDRIRREALAMARVSHENVAAVFEVGDAEGRLFIAMEYVDGPRLDAWLAAEPRSGQAILAVFAAIGRGLDAAHREGLVHRDLKPANVLVTRTGRPLIIDFGLARLAQELAEAPVTTSGELRALSSTLTRTGDLHGTPAYMAPEVLAGAAPTAASDQFAFCVALFEALYGRPPFPRDSLPVLLNALRQGALDVPADAQVPEEVCAILRRGLSADPAGRWPSMQALAEALESVDAYRPELARGGGRRILFPAVMLVALVAMTALLPRPEAIRAELVVAGHSISTAVALLPFAIFHRWWGSSELNRRLRRFVLLVLSLKLALVLIGARLGMIPTQLDAIDAVAFAGLMTVAGLYLRYPVRLALGLMLAALAAMGAWPALAFSLHKLIAATFLAGLIYGDWALRRQAGRAAARPAPAPPPPPDR